MQLLLVIMFSSVSTVSYMDEPGHHEDSLRPAIQMENTYQLGKYNFHIDHPVPHVRYLGLSVFSRLH